MLLRSFNLTQQGASHVKNDKECQDASESCYTDNYAIAIVCDGHGGEDYVRSAVGSSLACDTAKELIINFIAENNAESLAADYAASLKTLEEKIISQWNEAVLTHFEDNPLTEAETADLSEKARRRYLEEKKVAGAYGTTLIAVAITEKYWFGIHIGDGKCIAVNPEGKFLQPIPWDKKCFLNSTTSICDTDAINNFRHFYSEKLPYAVFVGSDGIDGCFNSTERLKSFYNTVLYSFANGDFDTAVSELYDYLPRLSAKGSGDDMSIAAILDMDNIGSIESVKNFDAEKEKARVEENARLAAVEAEEERKRVEAERAEQLREQQELKEQMLREQQLREQQRKERLLKERQLKEQQRKEKAEREKKSIKAHRQPQQDEYCTYCGALLTGGMQFCGKCGNKVETAPVFPSPASTEAPPEPPLSSKQAQPEESAAQEPDYKAESKSGDSPREKGELTKMFESFPQDRIKDFAVGVVDELIHKIESTKPENTKSDSSDDN